ncbi:S46 family peptidase [Bryobacter aggregatus]|uniref:S46 family peptidase n=1 Tax=Bryobacter aggregatus TaxID=360054 RepID=UPI0009B5CE14|nr:S46 family peptidase [Bryobacter aggregatus]
MKNRLFAVLCGVFATQALADNGIWLFNEFPREAVKSRYGFEVTDAFLKKLQTGSVRFNNGGSGSFVSADGLVFTNHHVGADCIQKISSKEHDYMKNGFFAKSRGEEQACPDLELNVLLKIENVTEKVKSAVPAGKDAAAANALRRAEMSAIEKACSTSTGHRCNVVTLFSGGQYHLYEYQKYTDIRLVFAPEKDIAFFGGDADNFTYPRYDLDIAFFRVYENGKPLRPIAYFPFSKEGVKNGELAFVSGNPGSTGRLLTYAEMEFQRDVQLKLTLERIRSLIAVLKDYSKRGPEEARVALEEIFGEENSLKAFTGFMSGLTNPSFMAKKKAEEDAMRAAIAKDPEKEKLYGSAWTEIEKINADFARFYQNYVLFETTPTRDSVLMTIGRRVYRYANEKAKPNGERLREYSDAGLESLEQEMYSTAPISPSLEEAVIAEYLRFALAKLGPENPTLKEILGGKSPEAVAKEAVATTKLLDVAERKRIANSRTVANTEPDGILRIIRALEPEARRYRQMYEDRVMARQAIESARIAQAQYALGGNVYPDATFTLRLSFGTVKGYRNAKGEAVNWSTDFAGLYKHATGQDPFALPQRWLEAKKSLALKTPFNFVTTADTHGGNSGSPTLNTKGEVIGILFDGNIEGLPNRYLYTDEQARSVHVASQGILEALRKVYRAQTLLEELERR